MKARRKKRAPVELVVEDAQRVAPRCPHFGTCGGCSFQDIAYEAQLTELSQMLERTLARLGDVPVAPILPCEDPWHYRNKMDFTFGNERWIEASEPEGAEAGFAVGLHPRGRFDKVLDVQRCDIAFPEAGAILHDARTLARAQGLSAWDVRAHRGLLRHLVLRKGYATGEILVQIVTTETATAEVDSLARELLARHPEVTTLVQTVNPGVALVAVGDEERVLHGSGRIQEELGELRFSISAVSFFQTNTPQAEKLIEIVLACSEVEAGVRVFDFYCGCGTFTLPLAKKGADVIGFELVEAAVEDARRNARLNGLDDVRFVAGDIALTLSAENQEKLSGDVPHVCVVDPPRAGMQPRALGALRRIRPERIIYVSCEAKSAVRDLVPLKADGYSVVGVQPIDLFPHTPHLESVFTLTL